MNGRNERDKLFSDRTRDMLKGQPSYLKDYVNSLMSNTEESKNRYIRIVLAYLSYLESEFNIDRKYFITKEVFKNIRPASIYSYLYTFTEVSQTTLNTYFYGVKSFFTFLEMNDYIIKNPCDKVRLPTDKTVKEHVYLEDEEIDLLLGRLLDDVNKSKPFEKCRKKSELNDTFLAIRNYTLISFALMTGLRRSSIIEINVDDVDLRMGILKITEKGNKERVIELGDALSDMLETYLIAKRDFVYNTRMKINPIFNPNLDALFINPKDGRRIGEGMIKDVLDKYSYGIDKNLTAHKLRHTFGTIIYNETGDIHLTSQMMGHANITTTQIYAHIKDNNKQKANRILENKIFK